MLLLNTNAAREKLVDRAGIAPASAPCERAVLLLALSAQSGAPVRSRTEQFRVAAGSFHWPGTDAKLVPRVGWHTTTYPLKAGCS